MIEVESTVSPVQITKASMTEKLRRDRWLEPDEVIKHWRIDEFDALVVNIYIPIKKGE